MKELVEYIARAIVDNPEEVKVTEEPVEGGVNLKLEVAPVSYTHLTLPTKRIV